MATNIGFIDKSERARETESKVVELIQWKRYKMFKESGSNHMLFCEPPEEED